MYRRHEAESSGINLEIKQKKIMNMDHIQAAIGSSRPQLLHPVQKDQDGRPGTGSPGTRVIQVVGGREGAGVKVRRPGRADSRPGP